MARLRIRDIAEQAGVSPATVSRYLNNQPGQMTEATKERIAEVIKRTGYRPRSAARNLRSARSGLIGIVMDDISNPYSSSMLEHLSDYAAERGCFLMTSFSGGSPQVEAAALNRLVDAGVDGLIVNTCGGDDEPVIAASRRVPTVLLDRPIEESNLDVVTSNNVELMTGLVKEVAKSHCRSICLLTEEDDASSVRRVRLRAYLDACASLGLEGKVIALRAGAQSGADQIGAFVADAAGGSMGLISINGLVFLRLVEAITQIGSARFPSLALATFDDYPWNHVLFGGVTTAAQDTLGIARAVIDRLMRRIDVALTAVGEPARMEPVVLEVPGKILIGQIASSRVRLASGACPND